MDGHRTGPEPARMQIYGTERAGDRDSAFIVRCVGGIVRVGLTFVPDPADATLPAGFRVTLTGIERYRRSADFFDPPHAARVTLTGPSAAALVRGSVIVEAG
ncbi:hypothetical protein NJO91_25555 [Streptomyces microflavus]|uniref:hypothetical protein n=1 Tax=Streptomyces microflavus TaxID=1919 RepID=UPI0029A11BB2|nr:hypothetical protein [Streptomyces microflavus]MDX2406474.1 hypothetical protein [Streptomyces microflavus]